MKNKFLLLIMSSIFLALILSCSLPFSAPSPTTAPILPFDTSTASPEPSPTPRPSATSEVPPTDQPPETYTGLQAVILVDEDDVLNIRSGAGVSNPIVGSFSPIEVGVRRSGSTTMVGSDLWVEVENPSGGLGWVNAYYLTETIPPEAFCGDDRVLSLLETFRQAVTNADGELFASLVSPVHGLEVYYRRYGPSVNYSPEEASWVFQSTYQVNWGAGASGIDDVGTFGEVPLPKLLEVLNDPNYEQNCNDITYADMFLEPWPKRYSNINFYALHKPATPDIDLDWRTWLVGIEYAQDQPSLFALIHFEWEP